MFTIQLIIFLKEVDMIWLSSVISLVWSSISENSLIASSLFGFAITDLFRILGNSKTCETSTVTHQCLLEIYTYFTVKTSIYLSTLMERRHKLD